MPVGAAQDSNASISSGLSAGFPVFPTHLAYTLYLCTNQFVAAAHEHGKAEVSYNVLLLLQIRTTSDSVPS